jgi:hypothetical protein
MSNPLLTVVPPPALIVFKILNTFYWLMFDFRVRGKITSPTVVNVVKPNESFGFSLERSILMASTESCKRERFYLRC